MKGVLISVALFLGLGFYILNSYASLGKKVVAQVALEENGRTAIDDAVAKDEKAFIAKYQPLLDRRWTVALFANILDDQYFLALSKESLELYTDTPLETSESFGNFIFARAKALQGIESPATLSESFSLYKRYVEAFPNGPKVKVAKNAISALMTSHGLS